MLKFVLVAVMIGVPLMARAKEPKDEPAFDPLTMVMAPDGRVRRRDDPPFPSEIGLWMWQTFAPDKEMPPDAYFRIYGRTKDGKPPPQPAPARPQPTIAPTGPLLLPQLP